MAITIESGARSAKFKAAQDSNIYREADNKFGGFLNPYLGDLPKGFAIGHLLRVNRKLLASPPFTEDRRRGFMLATINMARESRIEWSQLDDALTCGYVWGRDINSDALSLYTTYGDLFSKPGDDFWRTAYLRHVLGDTAFKALWGTRDTGQATIYDSLIYAVNARKKSLAGWPVIKLKNTVLVGCEYVYQIAKRAGSTTSKGWGIQPVMSRANMLQVFK